MISSYSVVTAAAPSSSGIASPSSVVFAYRPRVVEPAQHRDALVERLAGDEASGAHAPAVVLHEPLQSGALGCVEDRHPRQRREC